MRLNGEEFFEAIGAQPRYIGGGKFLLRGLCHHSSTHTVVYDENAHTLHCTKCGDMGDDYFEKAFEGGFDISWTHYRWDTIEENFKDWRYVIYMLGIEEDEWWHEFCKRIVKMYWIHHPLTEESETYFLGKPLKLKRTVSVNTTEEVTAWGKEEVEKVRNKYTWVWGEDEYTRSGLFAAAFKDFALIKKKVVFDESKNEDLLRISTTQRRKLAYTILANKYKLVDVDDIAADELLKMCRQYNNQTTQDTSIMLMWEDGLAKMVTFGLGLKPPIEGEASMTWSYQVEQQGNKIKFSGVKTSWEVWQLRIEAALKQVTEDGLYLADAWNVVRPLCFCQGGTRMTLNTPDRHKLFGYITNYLNGNTDAAFPLSGEVGDDYYFEIDLNKDVKIEDADKAKSMAEYNKKHAAKLGAARGNSRIRNRFLDAFPTAKIGDTFTTKQLEEAGYNRNSIKNLEGTPIGKMVLKRQKRGVYVLESV